MMSNIPIKAAKQSKHPVIEQYEKLLENYSRKTSNDWDKSFIKFYNDNINFIDNIEDINSNNAISKIITIKIIYSRILDDKGKYKETAEIAKDLQYLINKLDKNYFEYEDQYSKTKKWIAISLGRNKKYKESNKIFKEIIHLDDNKEFYINWIAANYYNYAKGKLVIIMTICLIIFLSKTVINIFTDDPSYYISRLITLPASIILFIVMIIYFNLDKLTRKIVERKYKE